MQFDSIQDFFAMGGYALYVWWSVGLAVVLVLALIIWSKAQRKSAIAHIEQAKQIEQLRKTQVNSEMTL